jgi:superfamily I DNA/RNA helicase
VGFTRARKFLRVTWCEKRQDSFARNKTARFKSCVPSRFLMEAGLVSEEEYKAMFNTRAGKGSAEGSAGKATR